MFSHADHNGRSAHAITSSPAAFVNTMSGFFQAGPTTSPDSFILFTNAATAAGLSPHSSGFFSSPISGIPGEAALKQIMVRKAGTNLNHLIPLARQDGVKQLKEMIREKVMIPDQQLDHEIPIEMMRLVLDETQFLNIDKSAIDLRFGANDRFELTFGEFVCSRVLQ